MKFDMPLNKEDKTEYFISRIKFSRVKTHDFVFHVADFQAAFISTSEVHESSLDNYKSIYHIRLITLIGFP